jgi:aminoglycoside 6-adenylyltransferase
MRSEEEMFRLIVDTARQDERIRAVIMNGSRANPSAPHDRFQDFDIVYVVTDVAPFRRNFAWIRRFGELMIVQLPDDMQDPPPSTGSFAYLMQFADGNRIDLTLFPLDRLDALGKDSESVLLLDKDDLIPPLLPPSDSDYLPTPPTAKAFFDCCNEFWWVCPYVAKGIWREELPYARYMLDEVVREQLRKMLAWYVGVQNGFTRNPGKFGKYLKRYLEPQLWALLEKTYADADYAHTWDALYAMCDLFRIAATTVAARCALEYPHGEDARVSAHLRHVQALPRDAAEIY